MSEAELEVRRLRQQLAALKRQASDNYDILRRSRERELVLLKAEHLPELLERLVNHLADSYGLTAVSVVLVDASHEIRHLLLDAGRSPEDFPGVKFVDGLAGLAPHLLQLRGAWLGPYAAADHQLLFDGRPDLGSIALLPLQRQGWMIGALNLGSRDPTRFTRHHGTEFLSHLGVIASFCIENTINRARLLRSGFTDVLTGWHNRRYLQSRLREELARAHRDDVPLSCLMLDVDHFKRVNDTLGHLAGDRVLREIAHRVEAQIRASDVAARYGGEEFALLLPATGLDDAARMAERIRAAVAAEAFDVAGETLRVTLSIGVSEVRPARREGDHKSLGEELFARADVALYQAKGQGRDRVCTG